MEFHLIQRGTKSMVNYKCISGKCLVAIAVSQYPHKLFHFKLNEVIIGILGIDSHLNYTNA